MSRQYELHRASAWWIVVYVLLVSAAYVLADGFSLFRMAHYQWTRQDVSAPLFNTTAFAGSYLCALLSLLLLHGHARPWVRYGAFAIAMLSVGVFSGFAAFNGRGFTVTEASVMWQEVEFVPGAIRFFFWDWVPALIVGTGLFALLEWIVRTRLPRIESLWLLALPGVAALLCYQLVARTDAKVDQFPLTYRVPVLTAYAYAHQSVYLGTRDEPYIDPARSPLADHIVLIVDESIRGDLLSINGGPELASPYLQSIRDRILNYGVASSVANLSAPAHIVMQSGLRPDQFPDQELRSMKNPNLFSYLRAADFYTSLINAQNALARPPNFMTDADIEGLDSYVQILQTAPELERHQADRQLPALLAGIISEHERSFSYVIKMGAHFPYSGSYPSEARWFEAQDYLEGHDSREAEVISSYMNALRWSVDEFFAPLLPALEGTGKDVLVIYTSDHGQSLYDKMKNGKAPVRGHGQHDAPPSHQAMIPFFLLPLGSEVRGTLAALYAPSLANEVSAFELFPSLLLLAGYAPDEIGEHYSPSIFDADAQRGDRGFVSGNHFGADGPLYRQAPYRSSFGFNAFDPDP